MSGRLDETAVLDSVNTGRQWKRGGWSIWLVESTCTHTRSQGGKHWARGFLRWRIDFLDIVVRLSRFTTGLPDVQSAALTYPHCVNVNIDFWQLLRNEHCHHRGRKGAHEVHTQLAHTHSLSLSFPFSFSHSLLHSLCHRCLLDDLTPRVSATAMLLRSYRKRGTLAWRFSRRNEIHRIRAIFPVGK